MSNYLWDRSGAPDPDIQRLEQLLAPLRFQSGHRPTRRNRTLTWIALAACLLLSIGLIAWRALPVGGGPTGWVVAETGQQIYAGQVLRPGGERLALASNGIGRVELEPGSELRLAESSPGRQRMQLQRGHLHALIWARPTEFVVDTPAARTIDLGCQYDLTVDDHGDGFLRVQTGWVAFQSGSFESFIPAGAACRTKKERGPGIPYFEDAPTEFRLALEQFERGGRNALSIVLANARPQDGLTLWHLLKRANASERGAVFDRLAQMVPLPPAVKREKAVTGDGPTLDICWRALGFADAQWWREWKRKWR